MTIYTSPWAREYKRMQLKSAIKNAIVAIGIVAGLVSVVIFCVWWGTK